MKSDDALTLTFAALADPTRREILTRLSQGPASVGQVAEPFTMSAPAISQHLKVLERAGLITRSIDAQRRTLSLQTQPLEHVSDWVAQQRHQWTLRLDALQEHLETMKQAAQETTATAPDIDTYETDTQKTDTQEQSP